MGSGPQSNSTAPARCHDQLLADRLLGAEELREPAYEQAWPEGRDVEDSKNPFAPAWNRPAWTATGGGGEAQTRNNDTACYLVLGGMTLFRLFGFFLTYS